MTNVHVLKACIDRANANGMHHIGAHNLQSDDCTLEVRSDWDNLFVLIQSKTLNIRSVYPAEIVLFDHKFAQALWGEAWKEHITALALAENRVQYLRDWLEKGTK